MADSFIGIDLASRRDHTAIFGKVVDEGAVFSSCKRYRYALHRHLRPPYVDGNGSVLWVMLNPSTADASLDDPTIRRCIRFSEAWGYRHMLVANLYAWQSSTPKRMWQARADGFDVVGQRNDQCLVDLAAASGLVVAAWGDHAEFLRVRVVLTLFRDRGWPVYSLARNASGAPRHPLARGRIRIPDSAVPTLHPTQ